MYIAYLAILLFLLIIVYYMFNREIMSPAVLLVFMFFFCSLIGILRWNDWELSQYGFDAVLCILVGVMSFIVASVLGSGRLVHKLTMAQKKPATHENLWLGTLYIALAVLFGLAADLLFYVHIRQVVTSHGYPSGRVSQLLLSYYQIKRYHNEWINLGIAVKYMGFLANANAVISIYALVHNVSFRVFKKKDLLHFIVIGLYVGHALLNSSRGEMLLLMAEMAFLFYFFMNIRTGWSKKVNQKIASIGIWGLTLIFAAFLVLAVVMGRRESLASIDVLDYLTIYAGAGIRGLDLYMKDPVINRAWGTETFYSIAAFLNNRLGLGQVISNSLEYRNILGVNVGNIYTAFRRFYADFGYLGVIVLPGLLGFFYSKAFYRIKKMADGPSAQLCILLFSYLSTELFFMPIEERFYLMDFSVNGLVRIIMIVAIFKLFIEDSLAVKRNGKPRLVLRLRR